VAVGATVLGLAVTATDAQVRIVHGDAFGRLEQRLVGLAGAGLLRIARTDLDAGRFVAVVAQHRDHHVQGVGEGALAVHHEVGPVVALAVGAVARVVFGLAGKGTGAATYTP
jgi:hypothetical protein